MQAGKCPENETKQELTNQNGKANVVGSLCPPAFSQHVIAN